VTDIGRETKRTFVPALVLSAVSYELGLWQSLYRWTVRSHTARGTGAETFGYASPVTPVLAAFIGLSAIEIPVVTCSCHETRPGACSWRLGGWRTA
jgi:hypothetical protein